MDSLELENLYEISSQNPPSMAELPGANENNICIVDLRTRKIASPEFLSVIKDHKAEVLYFVVDRFYDYMDLSTTTCLVQYSTKSGDYIYIVPYFDIYNQTFGRNKMIIPWNIDGSATRDSGTIKYSLRFYKIDGENREAKLVYNLNTLPAESKILKGLDVDPLNKEEIDFETEAYEQIMQHIAKLYQQGTYWEISE